MIVELRNLLQALVMFALALLPAFSLFARNAVGGTVSNADIDPSGAGVVARNRIGQQSPHCDVFGFPDLGRTQAWRWSYIQLYAIEVLSDPPDRGNTQP